MFVEEIARRGRRRRWKEEEGRRRKRKGEKGRERKRRYSGSGIRDEINKKSNGKPMNKRNYFNTKRPADVGLKQNKKLLHL